jgi:muramoyltetrapeptide carboxypeptidase
MITPTPLNIGDTIGVMAPSSRIAQDDIQFAKSFLESKGFKVFIHPQCLLYPDGQTQFAGSVNEKVQALHDLVKNPDIKAIFFATGGTRCVSLLDHLDYDAIAAHPKIYLGFSDNTALLNAICARANIITYHGPTFKRLPKNPQADFNLRLLGGLEKTIPLGGAIPLREGRAQGRLMGGNLAVFSSLLPRDMISPDGAILFFEDINEEITAIDRALYTLSRRGMLRAAAGIIFGQFSNTKNTGTPFGMDLTAVINDHIKDLTIPILINAPLGHDADLPIFPVGQMVTLNNNQITLI